MTREQYRERMRRYSASTMTCSFVETRHPDYQAMREAGKEIIPFLLEDLLDPQWYCNACYGYGQEFRAGWQDNAVVQAGDWPPVTDKICPQCKGKGSINSWAAMTLLGQAAGEDRPAIQNWMRGRHDALTKVWQKWGEQRGHLPPTPEEPVETGLLQKLLSGFRNLIRS